MQYKDIITIEPGKRGGKPCIRGMRITVYDVRRQIEELHRGVKQLTGSEKCQCRLGQAQRNHLACC